MITDDEWNRWRGEAREMLEGTRRWGNPTRADGDAGVKVREPVHLLTALQWDHNEILEALARSFVQGLVTAYPEADAAAVLAVFYAGAVLGATCRRDEPESIPCPVCGGPTTFPQTAGGAQPHYVYCPACIFMVTVPTDGRAL